MLLVVVKRVWKNEARRVPILNMLIIEPSKTARGSCVHDGLYTLNV